MGDNGAGKSTLVKIMAGNFPASEGEIRLEGEVCHFHKPVDARAKGIEVVYQDLALCDNLDVVENLFLGREEVGAGPARLTRVLDETDMEQRTHELLENLAVTITNVRAEVGMMSGGQRQQVAIARSLLGEPKLVILDEPTAALGVRQTTQVLALIKRLRDQGLAVVVISHNLANVFEVADRIALAILFIWLIGPVSRLTQRLLPEQERPDDASKPRYLTEGAVENPSTGLANASREALRMGDLLSRMLDLSLQAFKHDDRRLVDVCSDVDSQIDRLNEAIKLYLTRVSRDVMDSGDHKKIIDLITFTTNLEHAADIVDKSLMDLAAKKTKYGLKFSAEGAKEIEDIHRRLNANVQLAMNVFMTGDLTLARKLFAEKQVFRVLEKTASENHLLRLREGRIESISTSGLHLDILRDLKRINSHLALVAQPRLEAAGELHPSRLKEEATA